MEDMSKGQGKGISKQTFFLLNLAEFIVNANTLSEKFEMHTLYKPR